MTNSTDEGRLLAGRYQLSKQLGQGGMGSVWRARDRTLCSDVAVKLIDPAFAQNEGLRARFYQEAKAAASLRSPHVVQILDYGTDHGVPFIAMELLQGESLAQRLERATVLPPAVTARVMTEVARAMKKAHEAGIVHRDLKPDNIFLVRNDDQEIAKVLDFGIAKMAGGEQSTEPTEVATPDAGADGSDEGGDAASAASADAGARGGDGADGGEAPPF